MTTTQVVVVEYLAADEPETPDDLARLKRCLAVREATLLRDYRGLSGNRRLRVFQAPDAGAVRYAHASAGYASVNVWPAEERDAF